MDIIFKKKFYLKINKNIFHHIKTIQKYKNKIILNYYFLILKKT
jgi:hypothetical protein